jgi:serine/threonine protein kinase
LEIAHLNIARLRAVKDRLHLEKQELEKEKQLHIKESKRISDEQASKYQMGESVLNGRYLLMSLLGRGGQSEVFQAYDMDLCRLVAGVDALVPYFLTSLLFIDWVFQLLCTVASICRVASICTIASFFKAASQLCNADCVASLCKVASQLSTAVYRHSHVAVVKSHCVRVFSPIMTATDRR